MIRPSSAVAFAAALLAVTTTDARAQATMPQPVRITIPAGKTSAKVSGRIKGDEFALYTVSAREGQSVTITLRPTLNSTGFNVYAPGKGPGDESLYNSEMGGGLRYAGRLSTTGDHTISVFLNRSAARKGLVTSFDLVVGVTGGGASTSGGGGADAACVAAVREQTNEPQVSVISSTMGETATTVLLRVRGAAKPWRCRWDGRRVIDVMYTGQG